MRESGSKTRGPLQGPLVIPTKGQGLYEISSAVSRFVQNSEVQIGLCHVFVQHTSCSLVIQENADPTARADLEAWMGRLAPEHDPAYTHTLEGPDDMPAHLRSAVTQTSAQIPIFNGTLASGTWQGLYLWEHRREPQPRNLFLTIIPLSP